LCYVETLRSQFSDLRDNSGAFFRSGVMQAFRQICFLARLLLPVRACDCIRWDRDTLIDQTRNELSERISQPFAQVKPVADLHRLRVCRTNGVGIERGPVAAHHFQIRKRGQPGSYLCALTRFKHIHYAACINIHHDRSVCVPLFSGKIINTDTENT
jgi:hypothetical protein